MGNGIIKTTKQIAHELWNEGHTFRTFVKITQGGIVSRWVDDIKSRTRVDGVYLPSLFEVIFPNNPSSDYVTFIPDKEMLKKHLKGDDIEIEIFIAHYDIPNICEEYVSFVSTGPLKPKHTLTLLEPRLKEWDI